MGENIFMNAQNKRSLLLALLMLPGLMSHAQAMTDARNAEYRFRWREATTRMSAARTPDAFAAAAEGYRMLARSGISNPTLFYNLGTACLEAEQFEEAWRWLLRAERLAGADPEIRRNLLLAYREMTGRPDALLPWYRVPLFWHISLPLSLRITFAISAFALIWIHLTLKLLMPTYSARPLMPLLLTVCLLFSGSILSSWYDNHRDLDWLRAASQPTEAAQAKQHHQPETQT